MGTLTYTTQEVQDRLDAVGTYVRPNLIINGYFIGGGSQQGGGQFPINQRGQTSYTGGNIYGIDRWKSTGSNTVIAVEPGCLSFTPSGPYSTVRQYIEDFKSLSGKTVTISAIVEADAAFDFLMILQYHDASNVEHNPILFAETVSNKRLVTATGAMPDLSSAKDCYLRIGSGSTFPNIPLKIYAAKVELGDTQTLAHQENGVWVLNEIPNYQQELAKCQRYCYVSNTGGASYARFGVGFGKNTSTVSAIVTFPVTMRAIPTLTYTGAFRIEYASGSANISSLALDTGGSSTDMATVNATVTATADKWYMLIAAADNSARLIFSADL